MVTTLPRSLVERARRRTRGRPPAPPGQHPVRESGSLILDILIGMAIFALIAIIAVSAVGQYRMRAYTQAAVSDAAAAALAINAHLIDQSTSASGAGTYPSGVLSAADLDTLEVSVTTSGPEASQVTVTPHADNPEAFDVCVEHRGAYAVNDSESGLVASGNAEKDNFEGCGTTNPGGGGGGGEGGGEVAVPINVDATVAPGTTSAAVTWIGVPGATSYTVKVDGDPAWTGTGTSHTVDNLAPGQHTITVTALVDGTESPASMPVEVTVEGNGGNAARTCADGTTMTQPDARLYATPADEHPDWGWWTVKSAYNGTLTSPTADQWTFYAIYENYPSNVYLTPGGAAENRIWIHWTRTSNPGAPTTYSQDNGSGIVDQTTAEQRVANATLVGVGAFKGEPFGAHHNTPTANPEGRAGMNDMSRCAFYWGDTP